MKGRTFELVPLSDTFAVCRLKPGEPIPDWAASGEFLSITRTREELSIACRESSVPPNVRCECGWRCFQLRGPFDFSEVGILRSLIDPLAEEGIGLFAISTFDTDYVMVKLQHEAPAKAAWVAAGHVIAAASSP